MTKFDDQQLFRLSDVAEIFADLDVGITMVRLHAAKGNLPVHTPAGRQGRITLMGQDDLLSTGVFYRLLMSGLAHSTAARIIKRLPSDTWSDVRDGFTRYAVIQLSGEGGIQFLCDIEELTAPKTSATLVIDLAAIRENVIRRVEETSGKRSKSKGLK